MDESIVESTLNMECPHPSTHASGRSCKRRLARVTSLVLYGRECTQTVVRFRPARKPQKTDGRREPHNQCPYAELYEGTVQKSRVSWAENCGKTRAGWEALNSHIQPGGSIDSRKQNLPCRKAGKARQRPSAVLPRLTGHPGISQRSAPCELSQFRPWLFSQLSPL